MMDPIPQTLETRFLSLGEAQLGKPYKWGFKPLETDPSPLAFDCSGLVHWIFAQVGIRVPDGSQNQYDASVLVAGPKLGDLGFLKKPGAPTHHVGIFWTDGMVLEAHGSAIWGTEKPYQVILRPQALWEKQRDFAGWRRFKALL